MRRQEAPIFSDKSLDGMEKERERERGRGHGRRFERI
jgi:hypothetical protein